MNRKIVMVLVAAAGLAAAASATAGTTDLIIGLTLQSGNDLLFDLGTTSPAGLTSGETWNLSSALTAAGISSGSYGSLQWGVMGDSGTTAFSTVQNTAVANAAKNTQIINAWQAMAGLISSAGLGNNAHPASTLANSWNTQTISGTLATDYHIVYGNPNITGFSSQGFWSAQNNNSAPIEDGTFSFNSSGILTYNVTAVPEPSTYGVVAGAGLLLLALRRKVLAKA